MTKLDLKYEREAT